MANHKRKRHKNARAGCLLCKPHKANGSKNKNKPSVKRKLQEKVESIGLDKVSTGESGE